MLYSLMMLISVNGHTDTYRIDHGLTLRDCTAALWRSKSQALYQGRGVLAFSSFSCDAEKKGR